MEQTQTDRSNTDYSIITTTSAVLMAKSMRNYNITIGYEGMLETMVQNICIMTVNLDANLVLDLPDKQHISSLSST